jgi:hypothetical protein
MRPAVFFRVVDKLDKLSEQEWRAFAVESGLTDDQVDGLLDLVKDDSLA